MGTWQGRKVKRGRAGWRADRSPSDCPGLHLAICSASVQAVGAAIVIQTCHMLQGRLGGPGSSSTCCCGLVPLHSFAAGLTPLLRLRLLLHQCHLAPNLEVKHPDATLPAGCSWPAVASNGPPLPAATAPSTPPLLVLAGGQ